MIDERMALAVGPSRADIPYERRGHAGAPVVLLVMGVAAQMVHWPQGFVDELIAHGLEVLRFDNRDAGRSPHWSHAAAADMSAVMRGDYSSVPYTLSDMAGDAIGLLDHLGIAAAHVVGASMGGAIAQTMAIEHPARVLSLTSMMSSTGDSSVGRIHPQTLQQVFGAPATTQEAFVARAVRIAQVVGTRRFPADADRVARTAALAWHRGHDDAAAARQGAATLASGDRTGALAALDLPTLVLHGLDDTMCDPSGGRATAAAIKGSRLVLVEGLGHQLPEGLWAPIAAHVADVVRAGECRRGRDRR